MTDYLKEINEAEEALRICKLDIDDILKDLKNTRTWSFLDIVSDNAFFSWRKRTKIRKINRKFERLNKDLKVAQRELKDVDLRAKTNLSQSNFDWWFDIAFDNIFTDMRIHGQINKTIKNLEDLKREIDQVLSQINRLK